MPEKVGYAVIDLETTGLQDDDAIIEVAVVLLNPDREITGYYDTLVNPLRDMAGTDIHGITAELVADAPTFPMIATTLATLLNGRKLVAHNAKFEARFLNREFGRVGIALHAGQFADTIYLARQAIVAESYRLTHLAQRYGIPLVNAHAAISDALATAVLFRELVNDPTIRRLTYSRVPRSRNFDYEGGEVDTLSWTSRIVDAGAVHGI